jgi:hypothetical protein
MHGCQAREALRDGLHRRTLVRRHLRLLYLLQGCCCRCCCWCRTPALLRQQLRLQLLQLQHLLLLGGVHLRHCLLLLREGWPWWHAVEAHGRGWPLGLVNQRQPLHPALLLFCP